MLEYINVMFLTSFSYIKLALLGFYCALSFHFRKIANILKKNGSSQKAGKNFNPGVAGANSWAIVTGGTSGIGKSLVEKLLALNYNVIDGARSEHENVSLNSKRIFMHLDLSCMKSVKEFADFIIENHFDIHLLINNAGVISPHEATSREGFETTVAVNYLGHVLLTMLLLPKLTTCSHPVKIVTVSSICYLCGDLTPKKLFHRQRFHSPYTQYALSKLLLVLFLYKLHRHLTDELNCRNVISLTVEPGTVQTNFYSSQTSISKLIYKCFQYLLREPECAASTILQSISSTTKQGLHFYNQHGERTRTMKSTYDEDMQDKIWHETMAALNLYM